MEKFDCLLSDQLFTNPFLCQFDDRTNPMDRHVETMLYKFNLEPSPFAAQFFGNAGREHMMKVTVCYWLCFLKEYTAGRQ